MSEQEQRISGIFDNPRTMARERWRDGKVVEFVTAALLMQKHGYLSGLRPGVRVRWGSFPAPPINENANVNGVRPSCDKHPEAAG